jgi:tetratricopeptide (TPR) repeat protein
VSDSYYTKEEAQALLAQGNDAFFSGKHDEAIAAYQKLVDHQMGGADVLFNLGTAQLAKGDLGQAVLQLERARRQERADDIETNLSLAQQRAVDQVVGGVGETPFLERLAHATDARLVGGAFLVFWWLAFALWWARAKVASGRLLLTALSMVLFVGAIGTGGVTAAQWYVARNVTEGVVQAQTIKVREQPSENGRVIFEVHAGLKVRLLDESGKFVRLRLSNGVEGWMEKEGVARL